MMLRNVDIVCFSSIDWDFIWQGHQEIMSAFAEEGTVSGKFVLLGLGQAAAARPLFWRAIRSGHVAPRTVMLLVWSCLGLRWPGRVTEVRG